MCLQIVRFSALTVRLRNNRLLGLLLGISLIVLSLGVTVAKEERLQKALNGF